MATTNRRHKRNSSDMILTTNNNESYDLVTDHNIVAPFEICASGIGLLSVLTHRQIIDLSFSKLYQLNLKFGWEKIFTQERQKLKPNDVSVLKCLVLNRLLHEYLKDSDLFLQKTEILYNDIKSRMTTDFPQWTSSDLFNEVRRWQDIQCRRRLFYFNHQEAMQLPGILMLQKAATNWCHCLITHCRQNKSVWESEGYQRFKELFQHSFIIVAQPTGSEGAAATQYTKTTTCHLAKLNARIICLLDPTVLKDCLELSNIDVTLYPLNREGNDKKEKQQPIAWKIRKVMSAEGVPVSIFCAEFHTLVLEKNDTINKRYSLNSTLCQLEFSMKIKIKDPAYEENILLTSQPFGICSHAQYFPKFVAQIFLYEMKQLLQTRNPLTDPGIITDFVRRYYIRMTGIELTDHTYRYIKEMFARAIEDVKTTRTVHTLDNIYEEILAKIISQIDFMVIHPVLSLMYDDSLFLGICNSVEIDRMLNGTREQPHMLLRFNNITNHQWAANPIVQFVIHNGLLKRASLDTKTFANELCRLICESISDDTKQTVVLSTMSPRNFTDCGWYFHEDLYRLNKIPPPNSDAYDPFLPILWMTMRRNIEQTNTISTDTTQKRKRNHSDSFPIIESVSSESQPITMKIIVQVDNKDNTSLPLQNSSIDSSKVITIRLDPTTNSLDKVAQTKEPTSIKQNQQWLIEMPGDLPISPAVIFRHLGKKFTHMSNHPDEEITSDYFIRPEQTIRSLSNLASKRVKSPFHETTDNSNSSSEISNNVSISTTPESATDQIKIKEEPDAVEYIILNDKIKYL